MTWLPFDEGFVDEISAQMDLRKPNERALRAVVAEIQSGDGREVVCDLATGVGKTYLAAALVDYVATKGSRNILIVTPGTTIQDKTIANFTPGHPKFVPGAAVNPVLVTAENFSRGQIGDALHDTTVTKLFIFNVQQLIKPTAQTSRRVRETDEFIGAGLYDHLRAADDLVIIADEHHVYSAGRAFSAAVRDLDARALVGLTATPDESGPGRVISQYSLAEAIADGLVKIPVIVYREDGIKDLTTQLADACHLRSRKETVWRSWAEHNNRPSITPVLFVVCQSISDAEQVAEILTGDAFLPGDGRVLLITSQSSDQALAALADVESPSSPVRAVVSVDKLKEGWDVKNIGVIVAYRALASQTLTEQILGRGLRLPFGTRVGIPAIDHLDLVAHDSYRQLLAQKNALLQRVATPAEVGQNPQERQPDTPTPLPLGRTSEAEPSATQEIDDDGRLHIIGQARIIDGEMVDGAEMLQLASLEAVSAQHERDHSVTTKILYKVDGAPSITFPRREREVLPVHFSLSAIPNSAAQAEGVGFATEFPVQLSRKALVAERDLHGDVAIREQRVQDEDATQRYVPVPQVRKDLLDRVWNLGLVDQSLPELNAAERIAKEFLLGAGVTNDEDQALWGERRAQQAANAIADLIRASYNMRRLQPQYCFRTVEIPVRQPMPSDVSSKWGEFVKRRWYGDWEKSIQPLAHFDAKTTEWALANLFDSAKNVKWWIRIYEPGDVWIERDNGRKYYPDFIVLDAEGAYWVVEGKADRDVDHRETIDKRKAAEDWARAARDDGRFGTWRYVFASEANIRKSRSWEELLTHTKPER